MGNGGAAAQPPFGLQKTAQVGPKEISRGLVSAQHKATFSCNELFHLGKMAPTECFQAQVADLRTSVWTMREVLFQGETGLLGS